VLTLIETLPGRTVMEDAYQKMTSVMENVLVIGDVK